MNDLQAARVPRTMTEKRAWTARTGRRKTLRSTMMAINFVVVVVVVIVVVVTPKSGVAIPKQNKVRELGLAGDDTPKICCTKANKAKKNPCSGEIMIRFGEVVKADSQHHQRHPRSQRAEPRVE